MVGRSHPTATGREVGKHYQILGIICWDHWGGFCTYIIRGYSISYTIIFVWYDMVNASWSRGQRVTVTYSIKKDGNMFPCFWQRMPSALLMEEIVTGG